MYKVINLFKHTNLNIAFRATNSIYKQLSDTIIQNKTNSSGIYKLKCTPAIIHILDRLADH